MRPSRTPNSGNLDRVQVIKGWLNTDGTRGEKVYDVAWSSDRQPGADGKLPSVGSKVDVPNATWTNTIGAPELITYWSDPDFDPALRAFYYVRVIEIPTPRWTAYEARYFNVTMDDNVPMTTVGASVFLSHFHPEMTPDVHFSSIRQNAPEYPTPCNRARPVPGSGNPRASRAYQTKRSKTLRHIS